LQQLRQRKKLSLKTKTLLTYTSGLSDHVNENIEWITEPHTKAELLDKIAQVKPHFEPGAKQQYSNGGFLLLGYIVEKITNKTYQAALKQRIINKIGLKNTIAATRNNSLSLEAGPYSFQGSWGPVKEIYFPNVVGVGDILSTPQDLSIFINSLVSGKLVSSNSYSHMKAFKGNNIFGMGLLKSPFYEKTLIGHNGGTYGSYSVLYTNPEDGATFAITTNSMNFGLNDLFLVLLKAYYNKPYQIPLQLKEEDLDELLGNYESKEKPLKILITKSGSVLVAQATGQPAFSLDAVNKDNFKREQYDVELRFNRAKGEMILVQDGKNYKYVLVR